MQLSRRVWEDREDLGDGSFGHVWEDRGDLDDGFLDLSPFVLSPYLQLLVVTVGIKLVTSDKVF